MDNIVVAFSWRERSSSKSFDPPWAVKHAIDDFCMFEKCFDQLFVSLAEALYVLHSGGFSHNDLHEANVLVSMKVVEGLVEGRLGICDWGRACSVEEKMRLSVLNKGGRDYIAPEHIARPLSGSVIKGEYCAPSTDVYSFGYLMKLVLKNREDRMPRQWLEIANNCQQREKEKRPSMQDVLARLKVCVSKVA